MADDKLIDFIFDDDLTTADPLMKELIDREEERQARQIILIPSESICAWPVRKVLDTGFTNLYAEGYPPSANTRMDMEGLSDLPFRLAHYRRYGDRRFYKGNAYVNLVESICRRRAAEAFATEKTPADKIFANVQPLSGAAANVAVFEAFVPRGETVMGMDLMEGGHLSHGSQFHMSGKHYNIVSYGVDKKTEKLDYEHVRKIALDCKPKMIIAGYTSYPWAPDFAKFREIADEVGAILMADIAHPAGMAVAGAYPNPIDWADVVTFTTHKTLMGPRAAVILTANAKYATRINSAVFPGEQGGPHMNTIAALAVAFKLAKTDAFQKLQHKIVDNAKLLAQEMTDLGLRVSYGGTDTHLLLIDLKALGKKNGEMLYGEPAATILELAGIILNKNTIPGDTMTPLASGLRLGTPWFTQRGAGPKEIKELARLIHQTLTAIEPFHYQGGSRILPRGKIDLNMLDQISKDVAALTASLRVQPDAMSYYPHYPFPTATETDKPLIKITGQRVDAFVNDIVTANLAELKNGDSTTTLLLNGDGKIVDEIALVKLPKADNPRFDGYLLKGSAEHQENVLRWLRGLAEGWVLFEPTDVTSKIDGPVIVEQIGADAPEAKLAADLPATDASLAGQDAGEAGVDMTKPYFIGQTTLAANNKPQVAKQEFVWKEKEEPLKRTTLFEEHEKLGGRIVPFAGYEMPVRYGSTIEEHNAVRKAAGLFDVSHMGCFEVSGKHAAAFVDLVTTNYALWHDVGKSFYAFLLNQDGEVIDDLIVYRLARDRFLMVVNAANEAKDWTWLNLVNSGEALIDRDIPSRARLAPVTLKNLKDEQYGEDRRVDLALQGPKSRTILANLADKAEAGRIKAMRRNECLETTVAGLPVVISRTGYTGETFGYEIFVHPDKAPEIWNAMLDAGKDMGAQAIGLGARDSLRIEAKLPLYGHELAGPYGISPSGAGFGSFVKLNKAFFIGKSAFLASERTRDKIVRPFRVGQKGTRPLKTGDPVIDQRGSFIGNITSAAVDGNGMQVGLAYLFIKSATPGKVLSFPLPPDKKKPVSTPLTLEAGARMIMPVEIDIL